MSEKEARLVRIVQRLETKIKSIWDENNSLQQKIELSVLDREISEENAKSLEAQLHQAIDEIASLQAKIDELNELNEINVELENSYTVEKAQLESEIARLKADLASVQLNTQQLESLKIELRTSERNLKAAKFDLSVLSKGLTATLEPLLGSDIDWLPIIEHLKINVDSHLDSYKLGDINLSQLKELLEDAVNNYHGNPEPTFVASLLSSITTIPLQLKKIFNYNPQYMQAIERIEHKEPLGDLLEALKAPTVVPEPTKSNDDNNDESNNSSLKMRIEILESKLEKAQDVANELDKLKTWQAAALAKEAQYHEEISALNKRLHTKDNEISRLSKAALPVELLKANESHQVTDLKATVTFLTRKAKDTQLNLDPLPETQPVQISKFAGHKRINHLRKTVFELAPIKQASIQAVDQEVQLMFI